MKIYVQSDVEPHKVLKNRGLGDDGKVVTFIANEVMRLSDPYVPMSSGSAAHFKSRAKIIDGGKRIVYPGPYAHYLWRGSAMAGRAPKHYTGRALNFHGAPMRGREWVSRMMADHGQELEKSVENFIKNGGG